MRSLPLLAMLSLAAAAPAQPIGGDVKSVGFRGQADMSQFVARRGLWTPICVDLQATSPTAKEVEVRFATRDLDGDTVEYSSGPVTLGAGVRRAGSTPAWATTTSSARRSRCSTPTVR